MKLVAAILSLAACGHHDDERKPCTKPTAHLEMVDVDDNSQYMKNVFAHVGSDRNDRPSDPDAIAAGVTAQVDAWSETETKAGMELRGATHTDYYLLAADRGALEKYLATLAPPPSDHKVVLEHVMPLPDQKDRRAMWRTYYVKTTKVIDETAIESANSIEPDDKRIYRPAVIVKLTPTGQAAFAEATAKRVGHKMATIVDGVVVTAPVLDSAIKGGSVMISMPSTFDADQLFQRLGC